MPALPPVPLADIKDMPYTLQEWFRQLRTFIASGTGGTILWANIDKTGSNLTDLVTRDHVNLQNLQGGTTGEYYHVTANEKNGTGIPRGIRTETGATYTVAATDYSIICNRAGTITLTLPTVSAFTGRMLLIRTITGNTVVSASSNVVPLAGGAAGTAILPGVAGSWALLQSDASNWQIMAS